MMAHPASPTWGCRGRLLVLEAPTYRVLSGEAFLDSAPQSPHLSNVVVEEWSLAFFHP